MLIDEVKIYVKAGNGGNGASSFHRTRREPKGGPDGGNGGNGGSIYFVGVNDITALSYFQYKKKLIADNGTDGKSKKLFGKNAEDLVIPVPIGTQVTDIDNNESFEVNDTITKFFIASGGIGGRGNDEFKSATNQSPRFAERGTQGQSRNLHLVLKIIADVGLIGLPNAGKSSLLSVLTNASPKIADYPFTTLEPNLGIMNKFVIADIPGLIEGASEGKGLGIGFLKHVQKTKILLHCTDPTANDPVLNYKVIRKELEDYDKELSKKPELLVITKSDLLDEDEKTQIKSKLGELNKEVFFVSIIDNELISNLKKQIIDFTQKQLTK